MPVRPSCVAAIATVAATTLAGCYTTRVVSRDVLRAAGAELERPRILRGDEVARLEPETMVRAQLASGGRTDWFRASGLRLSDDALLIAGANPATTFARGIRWREVGALELRSLDPFATALGTALFPVGLLMVLATPDNVAAIPRDDGHPNAPIPWTADVSEGRTLFTEQARRRANFQAIGGLEGTASFWGDFAAGAWVGARFRHLYEVSFRFRRLSIADAGPDGARVDRFGPGFGFGLHIDGDDDPRFALYFGGEITIAGKQVVHGGLHWGPRLAIGRYLSLMIAPLDIMGVSVERPGASSFKAFRIQSGLSLVGAY